MLKKINKIKKKTLLKVKFRKPRKYKKKLNKRLVKEYRKYVRYQKLKKRFKKQINLCLFIKLTVNNLFGYVINFFDYQTQDDKTRKFIKLKLISISLGVTGYKGPAKLSNVSLEKAGILLAKKLRKQNILTLNLILYTRLNRKIKEFLKGFTKTNKIKFKHVYFFSKCAHNGCRLKAKRRK
jgi:hypothetical protein